MRKRTTRIAAFATSLLTAASALTFSSWATLPIFAADDDDTSTTLSCGESEDAYPHTHEINDGELYSSADSINALLATNDPDPDDDTVSLNKDASTFICRDGVDPYTDGDHTNTDCGPVEFLGCSDDDEDGEPDDEITSLQFNFQVDSDHYDEYVVSKFGMYYGMSTDGAESVYWAGISFEDLTPYANEFSVVVYMDDLDITDGEELTWSNKFQVQPTWVELTNTDGDTLSETDIILVSITVNGTEDTSVCTDEDILALYAGAESTYAPQNSGGLWYTSALDDADPDYGDLITEDVETTSGTGLDVYEVLEESTLNTLYIDLTDPAGDGSVTSDGIVIYSGEDYDMDNYINSDDYVDDNGTYLYSTEDDETEMRAAGLQLNSHQFIFSDFDFANEEGWTVESFSLTISVPDVTSVTRFMYGGGINVDGYSVADTEYMKNLIGMSSDGGSYWYNDFGGEDYATLLSLQESGTTSDGDSIDDAYSDAGVSYTLDDTVSIIESGTNLVDQDLGNYFTVTWDVPDGIQDYVTPGSSSKFSFQAWYIQADGSTYNGPIYIVGASVTYKETETANIYNTIQANNDGTFEISDTGATLESKTYTVNETESVGSSINISYQDIFTQGTDYDYTLDPYAIVFNFSTDVDSNRVQLGMGTSVIEAYYNDGETYWYDREEANVTAYSLYDDDGNLVTDSDGSAQYYDPDQKYAILYYEPSTGTERDSIIEEYGDAGTGETAEYTAANGTTEFSYTWIFDESLQQEVSTENEEDNFMFNVEYASAPSADDSTNYSASEYTLESVTIYYVADQQNTYKAELVEGYLWVYPEELTFYVPAEDPDETDDVTGVTQEVQVSLPFSCESGASYLTAENTGETETTEDGDTVYILSAFVEYGDGTTKGRSTTITVTSNLGQTIDIPVTVYEIDASFIVDPAVINVGSTGEASLTVDNTVVEDATFTSSDETIASVDGSTITGVSQGEATISVTFTYNEEEEVTLSTTVLVVEFALDPSTVTLAVDGTQDLTATFNGETLDNSSVTYSSSTNSVASVSDGTITGKKVGTATITGTYVYTYNDEEYTLTATSEVTVADYVLTFQIDGMDTDDVTLSVGESVTLTAHMDDGTEVEATFTVDDESIASVDGTTITGVTGGTTTLTATYTDDSGNTYTGTATVTVESSYGDINLDGSVSVADVVLLQKYLSGIANLSDSQLTWADVNADGDVDATDLSILTRYVRYDEVDGTKISVDDDAAVDTLPYTDAEEA